MASVKKESRTGARGVELIRWRLRWRDADGRDRERRFKARGAAEAERVKIEGELAAGVRRPSHDRTVYEAGRAWIQSCRAGDEPLERSTIRQYTQHLELHVAPSSATLRERGEDPAKAISLRDDKLAGLTAPRVAEFRDYLIATRSRRMAAKVMTSLRMLLGVAAERGEITGNPAAAVRVKQQNRHVAPVAIPTKPELRAIVKRLAGAEPVGFADAVIATALFPGLTP